MSDIALSAAGAQLVAEGVDEKAVLLAEVLLGVYRSLRVLELMDESGQPGWKGVTADELTAYLRITMDTFGDNRAEVDAALQRFLEHRMGDLAAMPYDAYLRSAEWADVRYFALRRAGDRCQTCNASGRLQVHHRTYDHRGHERLDDVAVLCGGCHKAFHEHRGLAR